MVKFIYIVVKKQVCDVIQTIFEQAFGPSSMFFDFDGTERVGIYSRHKCRFYLPSFLVKCLSFIRFLVMYLAIIYKNTTFEYKYNLFSSLV